MSNSGGTGIITASSGFTATQFNSSSQKKYVDIYSYGTSSTDYTRRILGDATTETMGWYSGIYVDFVDSNNPWFLRGGRNANGAKNNLFSFYHTAGGAGTSSFRVIFSKQ